MTNTIQILSLEKTGKEAALQQNHKNKSIKVIEGYFFSKKLDKNKFSKISKILSNPISQTILTKNNVQKLLSKYNSFNWVVEIKFLPGVTDNISNTAKEIISDNLKGNFQHFNIGSTKILLIKGKKKKFKKFQKKKQILLFKQSKFILLKNILSFSKKINLNYKK